MLQTKTGSSLLVYLEVPRRPVRSLQFFLALWGTGAWAESLDAKIRIGIAMEFKPKKSLLAGI
jgi:hypothetical protein